MQFSSNVIISFVHLALQSHGYNYTGDEVRIGRYINYSDFSELEGHYVIYILGLLQDSIGCYARLNGVAPSEAMAFSQKDLDNVVYQTAKRVAKADDKVLPPKIRQAIRVICPCDDSNVEQRR
jgi:hypothetical protein